MMIKNAIKSETVCRISRDEISPAGYEELFSRVKYSNLLQSLSYARVHARMNQQKIRCGVIYINEEPAGLVLILEAGILRGAVQGVIVDRAPLWFEGFGGTAEFELFMQAFSRDYPKRFGRRIRFIPEVAPYEENKACLAGYGFISRSENYKTAWLDLSSDPDKLRANLTHGWKSSLEKAEKSGLDIVLGTEAQYCVEIIDSYERDKKQKGYNGVSGKFLYALIREFLVGKNVISATALLEGVPIAAIVVFIHGRSATYQVGYTSDEGRKKCAHHLLLWRVITALKERAVYEFDLGGVNEGQSEGIFSFKKATGARIVETCGLYS